MKRIPNIKWGHNQNLTRYNHKGMGFGIWIDETSYCVACNGSIVARPTPAKSIKHARSEVRNIISDHIRKVCGDSN